MASVSVRYIVLDVDASIAFYTQHLGFSVDMHPAPLFDDLAGLVDRLRQDGAHFRTEIVISSPSSHTRTEGDRRRRPAQTLDMV